MLLEHFDCGHALVHKKVVHFTSVCNVIPNTPAGMNRQDGVSPLQHSGYMSRQQAKALRETASFESAFQERGMLRLPGERQQEAFFGGRRPGEGPGVQSIGSSQQKERAAGYSSRCFLRSLSST